MSHRNLLLAALTCMMLQCISRASNNDRLGDLGSTLQKLPQALAPRIQFWDGGVVAFTDAYYRINADDTPPEIVTVADLEKIVSLGGTLSKPLALGMADGRLKLYEKKDGAWNAIKLPKALQDAKAPNLIPSTRDAAMLNDRTLFRFKDGKWAITSLPPVPHFYRFFWPKSLPPKRLGFGSKQVLYGSRLFATWNKGEFGGMVTVFDLTRPKDGWQQVSGHKSVSSHGIVGNQPITGITIDPNMQLWVSEGLNHRGTVESGLYRYNGSEWDTVVQGWYDIFGEFASKESGRLRFTEGITDVLDVVQGEDGKLYVLTGMLGIFTYGDSALKRELPFNFSRDSNPQTDTHDVEYGVNCEPETLVVDGSGNLYVSTGYYGILCFVPDGKKYHLKQIILPGAKE